MIGILTGDEIEALDGLLRAAMAGNHCFNYPEIARDYVSLIRQAQGLLMSNVVLRNGSKDGSMENVFGGIMRVKK